MKKFPHISAETILAIDGEQRHQIAKWGENALVRHNVGGWILIMEELVMKARREWNNHNGDERALHEIRQAVTVGVNCLNQWGAPMREPKP